MEDSSPNLRYLRHIDLNGFGDAGQQRVQAAKVAIIGMGGLGCPAAVYLASAGVGQLLLVDDDTIRVENLQRQSLYTSSDLTKAKVDTAAKALKNLNPDCSIIGSSLRVDSSNINDLLGEYSYILDCTDNFDARYLLNKYCLDNDKILIAGAAGFFDGNIFTFKKGYPCYRCLFPHQPTALEAPSCTESAVLGPLVGAVGSVMALECLKEIVLLGDTLAGRFVSISGKSSDYATNKFSKQKNCPDCSVIA